MKITYQLGLVLLAPWTVASAQPMNSTCMDAIQTYASFANVFVDFTRKNAEVLTQSSFERGAYTWFDAPVSSLQKEARINLSFLKGKTRNNKKAKCTLNYAILLKLSEDVNSFAGRKDVQMQLLASFTVSKRRMPAASALLPEFRKLNRKIGIVKKAMNEFQMEKCFDAMKAEGELKALSDQEASQIYARYLNNYLQKGGKIAQISDRPLQNSDSLDASLKKEISVALKKGENTYAENLQALLENNRHAQVYLARKSFHACPLQGTAKIKILVPSDVHVLNLVSAEEHDFIHQDEKLWNDSQAVQYSDTKVEQFPILVAGNKMREMKTMIRQLAKHSTESATFANTH